MKINGGSYRVHDMDISGEVLYDKSVTGKVWQLFEQPYSKALGQGGWKWQER